jgi:hypothetical protein
VVSPVRAGNPGAVVGRDVVGQAQQGGRQCRGILRHLPGVGDGQREQPNRFGQRALVDRLGKLNVDPGLLEDTGVGVGTCVGAGGAHLGQRAVRVASDPHRGMHQRDVTHREAVQQHGDRVHQHGCLIGDDL